MEKLLCSLASGYKMLEFCNKSKIFPPPTWPYFLLKDLMFQQMDPNLVVVVAGALGRRETHIMQSVTRMLIHCYDVCACVVCVRERESFMDLSHSSGRLYSVIHMIPLGVIECAIGAATSIQDSQTTCDVTRGPGCHKCEYGI